MEKIMTFFIVCLGGLSVQYYSFAYDRPSDNEIIIGVLKQEKEDGKILKDVLLLVRPKLILCSDLLEATDKEKAHYVAELNDSFKNKEYHFKDLLEVLIRRNRKPRTLSIKSDLLHGYIIDYNNKYERAKEILDEDVWNKCQKKDNYKICVVEYSLPAYDPETNIILIYTQTRCGAKAVWAGLNVYRYVNGKVVYLSRILLWYS